MNCWNSICTWFGKVKCFFAFHDWEYFELRGAHLSKLESEYYPELNDMHLFCRCRRCGEGPWRMS